MSRPALVLLDESTSGLDPLMQEEVEALLRETVRSGGTVFFSSHVLSEVEQVCCCSSLHRRHRHRRHRRRRAARHARACAPQPVSRARVFLERAAAVALGTVVVCACTSLGLLAVWRL